MVAEINGAYANGLALVRRHGDDLPQIPLWSRALAEMLVTWLNAAMSGATVLGAADDSRRAAGKSFLIVLAWHALPACDVIVGNFVLAREVHGDSFDPLVIGFHEIFLAASLLISLVAFGALTALGRWKPWLRRVWILGNLSAVTGILLSVASIFWIYIWFNTLAAMHR